MYVGNLNHLVRFSPDHVTVTETGKVPAMRKNGNPLKGESLFVYWQEKIYSGIDIRLPFEGQVFVDQIRLTFPEGSKLSGVSLFSGEKAQLLRKYSPETGHTISRPQIVLEANYETDLLILTLEGDFASVGLENLEITGSYGKIELYPTPVKAEISQVRVPVSRFAGFRSDCPEGNKAAAILGRKLGISLAAQENGPICFRQDPEVAENGFELQITEAEMRIRASDLRGFVYAAETVVKLLCQETLPVCQISDRPSMAFRGVHLFLPAREEIPFYRRLVEHILSPITYGGNIGYRSRRQNEPFEHSYYRHNGYTTAFMVDSDETRTPDGGYHCVYRYEWLNPSPEKPVESITLQRAEHCPDDVIIHKITTL